MSKSLGNIITLRELVAQGLSPRTIRFMLLSTHYRQRMNLSDETLAAGQASLSRLDTLRHAAEAAAGAGPVRLELLEIQTARQSFTGSIQDDLGIAGALAAVFELVSDAHRLNDAKAFNAAEGEALLSFWRDIDRVLGVLFPVRAGLDLEVKALVQARLEARKNKEFHRSDELRKELADKGYELKDTTAGTEVIWALGREIVTG